jgi:hypothetical protein
MMGDPPYPFTIDKTGTLSKRYGVTSLGTTLVYDRYGRVVDRLIDARSTQLEAAFAKAGVTWERKSSRPSALRQI